MLITLWLLLAMGIVLIPTCSGADLRFANLYSDLAKFRARHRSPQDLQSPQKSLPSTASLPPLPSGCGGQWNTNPILTAAPRLLTSVPNGKLFQLDSVSPPILLAHAWGSHYEMGFALGQMLSRPASILMVRAPCTHCTRTRVHLCYKMDTRFALFLPEFNIQSVLRQCSRN